MTGGSIWEKIRSLGNGHFATAGEKYRDLERLDSRFRLEKNGDSVPNWVNPLALIALKVVFAAQNQRFTANRAGEYFEQFGRNHDVPIVARKSSAISNQP